jgi:hypothetical protein
MKPSAIDLQFWECICSREHLPQWAHRFAAKRPNAADCLHSAINLRARTGLRDHFLREKSNACAVLCSVRNRGGDMRLHMVNSITDVTLNEVQPERVATYRRWLRRLPPLING